MSEFEIDVGRLPDGDPDGPVPLAIRADKIVLTRVLRPGASMPEESARIPPARLAYWLVDNWWRLRWESMPATGIQAEWRFAHDISSIGGGYAWPRVTFWGEGDRIGIMARSDAPGIVGPVRYLTDALIYVQSSRFETAIDGFIRAVADEQTGCGSDRRALNAQFDALAEERRDPDVAAWRRMEARLGFDPDEAPDDLIEQLGKVAGEFGQSGVEEAAAAAPGNEAAEILEREIAAAKSSQTECDLTAAVKVTSPTAYDSASPPWEKAEAAATSLRNELNIQGPLRKKALAELLETKSENLTGRPVSAARLSYSLRLAPDKGSKTRVALRSFRSHDRRFDFARVLGDAIWARGDRIGPVAASRTDRQKFQRAFAQSLLCPYADLVDYLGTSDPSDGDMYAAAQHFHVAERVVRTVLVNKHLINRNQIKRPSWSDGEAARLDELVEAA